MFRPFLAAVVGVSMLLVSVCDDPKPKTRKADPTSSVDDTHGTTLHVLTPTKLVGGALVVSSVRLAAPGYVGVLSDLGGSIGPVIGSSKLLKAGTTKNIHIKLTFPSGVKTTLVWVLVNREDNGDKKYDYPNGDMPFEGNSGVLALKVDLKS